MTVKITGFMPFFIYAGYLDFVKSFLEIHFHRLHSYSENAMIGSKNKNHMNYRKNYTRRKNNAISPMYRHT